jgi:hypothetical protein
LMVGEFLETIYHACGYYVHNHEKVVCFQS